MKQLNFLQVGIFACSHKLKVDQKIFWVGIVKIGCGQPGHRTLKLTVSPE